MMKMRLWKGVVRTQIPMASEYSISMKYLDALTTPLITSILKLLMMMEVVIIGSRSIPKHGPSMIRKMRTVCARTDLNTRSIHVMGTQM